MKTLLATILFLSVSTTVLARQPKSTLCGDRAQAAATALFKLNTGAADGQFTSRLELVEVKHEEENGSEVWDIHFQEDNAYYSPYRINVLIDGCLVVNFSMPYAG